MLGPDIVRADRYICARRPRARRPPASRPWLTAPLCVGWRDRDVETAGLSGHLEAGEEYFEREELTGAQRLVVGAAPDLGADLGDGRRALGNGGPVLGQAKRLVAQLERRLERGHAGTQRDDLGTL